jgi:hypothetical protein
MMAIFAIDNLAHTSYTSSNASIVFSIVSLEALKAVFIDRITIWDSEKYFFQRREVLSPFQLLLPPHCGNPTNHRLVLAVFKPIPFVPQRLH